MQVNQFNILKDKRFLPLFICQFFGAFHDNIFKNALVVMLVFGIGMEANENAPMLVTLAAALFILPFFLFSPLSGQLADKFAKSKVIRVVKLVELFIAILGVASLFTGHIGLCMVTLFALGAQSAFFGPSKYSILPENLKAEELVAGNALLNTGTFLAILIGTLMGTLLIGVQGGIFIVAALMLTSATIGYISAWKVTSAEAKQPELKIDYNPLTEGLDILRFVLRQKGDVIRSILGVSWFYFLGGMFMAQFPNYADQTLHADQSVLALFLVIFSVGIGVGGLLNNRLLKGRVEAVYVPLAVLGITIFAIDLYFASDVPTPEKVWGLWAFLGEVQHWRIMFDIGMIALCGGLYVVPLNAIIQHHTEEKKRARIIAGSSILDSVFIFASAILSVFLIKMGFTIRDLFFAFAVLNAAVAIYVCTLLPEYLMKTFLQGLFKLLYGVEVRGLENYEKAGKRAIIVSNHVSLLDPPILAAFLPGKPMFAINSFVAEWVWVKPFLKLVDSFPLDPTNPFSVKSLIKEVEKDKHCVIFPEGRLTETGALMKVYDGPGMVADKSGATILPVRIDGVQHTPFARLKGKVPLKSFPKVTITILPPQELNLDEELTGRTRRAAAGRALYDIMEDMMFETTDKEQTLYEALLKARHVNGDDAIIAEDANFEPMKFKKLLLGTVVLGGKMAEQTERGEHVGLLLPNSLGALTSFFALQAYGRVPCMLNFSAGAKAIHSACTTAEIKTVYTSRLFVEKGKLEKLIEAIEEHSKVIYLEDVKETVGVWNKLHGFLTNPAKLHAKYNVKSNDPAVVLFTSGSEGMPKGVVLSHANIMSNILQLSSRVDFNRQDIVFNCLPMFHSFGLTGGTLLPVLCGVKTFLYPSPLHYRIVPELVYSTNATIMFGTDTFLNGYARMANPYDFYRMRYIFAGAEKVKDETRKIYMDRFAVRILEGYGATETSPVLAVNSPMHLKPGTVGRLLPGIEYKLEDVPGVDEGGRLHVKGPNVMLGYYLSDKPGELQPPKDGWYDTGDIVDIDDRGYVKILGRAKRFAKIAGEMVSLASAEVMTEKVYPDSQHAVVAIPDAKKGEQLVLLTTEKKADKKDLSAYASKNGISELAVPKNIKIIDEIPLLGTGKIDYPAAQKLAEE